MNMRLVVDIKEERTENEACLWNNIACALRTASENEYDVHFENLTLPDVEYILTIIGGAVQTGIVKLLNGILIYKPENVALQFDFGEAEE